MKNSKRFASLVATLSIGLLLTACGSKSTTTTITTPAAPGTTTTTTTPAANY